MATPYNMSGFNDGANPFTMLLWANEQANYALGPGILIALWAILFMVIMRAAPPAESFAASAGIVTFASLAFLAAGLVGVFWVVGFGMLFALASVGLYLNNRT